MSQMIKRGSLSVASELASLVESQVLPGLPIAPEEFWEGLAEIYARFTPENQRLLEIRDEMQAQIDHWHEQHRGKEHDAAAYQSFLTQIGYLVRRRVVLLA